MDDVSETANNYLDEAKTVLSEREVKGYGIGDQIALAKFLYEIHRDGDFKAEILDAIQENGRIMGEVEESIKELGDNIFKLLIK